MYRYADRNKRLRFDGNVPLKEEEFPDMEEITRIMKDLAEYRKSDAMAKGNFKFC